MRYLSRLMMSRCIFIWQMPPEHVLCSAGLAIGQLTSTQNQIVPVDHFRFVDVAEDFLDILTGAPCDAT